MKKKIRTIEHASGAYKTMTLQILGLRFPESNSDTLETIGCITFQCDAGEDRWYGRSYKVETDNPDNLLKMGKLATFIKNNADSEAQPQEIKLLIGAEEHIYHCGQYIPVSCIGMRYYKVMDGASFYSSIIAPNDIIAEKQLVAKKWEHMKLVYTHTIAA